MQEVRFNLSFCRCAIKAAVAHELLAFNTSPNAQKYHAALTRQPPELAQVDFDSLSSLCQQYSQPIPEQHPQHVERSMAVHEAVDTSNGTAGHTTSGTHEAMQLQEAKPQGDVAQGSDAAVGSPQHAVAAGTVCSDLCGATAQNAADEGGVGLAGSKTSDLEVNCTQSRKLKRLWEACEPEHRPPGAVEHFVDALFESDEDGPEQVASGCDHMHDVMHDRPVEGNFEYRPERSAVAAVVGDEQAHVTGRAPAGGRQAPCEATDAGTASKVAGGSPAMPESGVSNVWTEVRDFVGMCLEPWLVSGVVNTEQSEVIIDKCVSKVLCAHAGRKDAAFLDAEGERIQGLVAKYADFVVMKSKEQRGR